MRGREVLELEDLWRDGRVRELDAESIVGDLDVGVELIVKGEEGLFGFEEGEVEDV